MNKRILEIGVALAIAALFAVAATSLNAINKLLKRYEPRERGLLSRNSSDGAL